MTTIATASAKTEKYPVENQVGSYHWCVLECFKGFDHDDRKPLEAEEIFPLFPGFLIR